MFSFAVEWFEECSCSHVGKCHCTYLCSLLHLWILLCANNKRCWKLKTFYMSSFSIQAFCTLPVFSYIFLLLSPQVAEWRLESHHFSDAYCSNQIALISSSALDRYRHLICHLSPFRRFENCLCSHISLSSSHHKQLNGDLKGITLLKLAFHEQVVMSSSYSETRLLLYVRYVTTLICVPLLHLWLLLCAKKISAVES